METIPTPSPTRSHTTSHDISTLRADYDLTTPFYSFFIGSRDPDNADNYIPQPKRHADVPVGVFSAVFLLLSGIDHLTVVIPGLKTMYMDDLRQNRNRFRWIEYACALRRRYNVPRFEYANHFRIACTASRHKSFMQISQSYMITLVRHPSHECVQSSFQLHVGLARQAPFYCCLAS